MLINLKELREKAKRPDDSGRLKSITRDELALMLEELLGKKIHVTQIARYEDDPGNVPLEFMMAWLKCLGTSIEEQLQKTTQVDQENEFDPGDPYAKLRARISLLSDYLDQAGSDPDLADLDAALPNLNLAEELVKKIGRKPNVVLSGAFDAGKSTLANWLMNSDSHLPTQYQPTTAVVTYIRHISDKPNWLAEDVVLLKAGFDPDKWMDHDHVAMNRIVSGNLETLRQFGTHAGHRFEGSGAEVAMVFLDSPILRACNLIDFPGYQNDEEDTRRADKATRHMNVLIYANTAQGFMNAQDMERLRYLLKQLPQYERASNEFPVFGNLYLVATHAGPQLSDEDLYGSQSAKGLLDSATGRILRELKDIELAARAEDTGKPIDFALLRSRIFPFWRENAKRSEALAGDLNQLLSSRLPAVFLGEADRQIAEFKKGAAYRFRLTIETYQKVLGDIEAARLLYKMRQDGEPFRRNRVKELRANVLKRIGEMRDEHLDFIEKRFAQLVDVERIERLISERYGNNKKEAQQFMATYVLNELQGESEGFAKKKRGEISEMVESYVTLYDHASGFNLDSEQGPVLTPFDSRGSFIGGMASVGAIGALSLWASSLGNLGGYIITAKAVSVLSALGIATGGTAGVMGIVSAIGGPVTLAIGLAAAIFFGLKALFGDSWESRLAKQIVERLKKERTKEKISDAVSAYWDQTNKAFEQAARSVEKDFMAEFKNLEQVFTEPAKRDQATRLVAIYEKAERFFAGMPWIQLRPGQVCLSCSSEKL